MLQNAYFLAKIGADTAANERNFAEILPKILPKIGDYPTGPLPFRPDRMTYQGVREDPLVALKAQVPG